MTTLSRIGTTKLMDERASSLPSMGSFAAMGSLCFPATRYT